MSYFVVDVEADGPCPSLYSMVCFGAVLVTEQAPMKTFYARLQPLPEAKWDPQALKISGFTREETCKFEHPGLAMNDFADWINLNTKGRPIFISDNNGFDWQFINYYFHRFHGSNPFGFSSRRVGDLYCGMKMDTFAKWKHLRKTAHTHNPVDDAMGNAEVLIELKRQGLNIKLG